MNTGTLFGVSDSRSERAEGSPGGVPDMVGPDHQHEAFFFDALLGLPITDANASVDEGPVNPDVARQAQQADTVMRASS